MHSTRRRFLSIAALSTGLAGCTSGGDGADGSDGGTGSDGADGNGDGDDGGSTTATPSNGDRASSPTVQVAEHPNLGDILVDDEGLTLYMFDSDTRGEAASTCYDGCAEAWPPLTVDGEPTAGEDVTAALSTFDRDDGSTQVAAGGWPLYYFAADEEPGDANGQAVNDVWWVLRPDGTPVRPDSGATATIQVSAHPDLGDILVDGEGMTLYMFDSDTQGELASTCYDGCAEAWPPLTVEGTPTAGDGVTAELATFDREDGSTQVAAGGWPLYYFASDEEPGDVNGQAVNDVWWVLRPDGTPVRPAPTVQVSTHDELGDILVDSEGLTLYMFDSDTQGELASTCSGGCAEAWPPLTVDGEPTAGEDVTAELATFDRDDGSTQVAAGGWPLYYFASDEEPGDVNGQGVNDVWWALDPSGEPIRS